MNEILLYEVELLLANAYLAQKLVSHSKGTSVMMLLLLTLLVLNSL
jgi:hypothetical protein